MGPCDRDAHAMGPAVRRALRLHARRPTGICLSVVAGVSSVLKVARALFGRVRSRLPAVNRGPAAHGGKRNHARHFARERNNYTKPFAGLGQLSVDTKAIFDKPWAVLLASACKDPKLNNRSTRCPQEKVARTGLNAFLCDLHSIYRANQRAGTVIAIKLLIANPARALPIYCDHLGRRHRPSLVGSSNCKFTSSAWPRAERS